MNVFNIVDHQYDREDTKNMAYMIINTMSYNI